MASRALGRPAGAGAPGRKPYDPWHRRGTAGVTHCGAWRPVPPGGDYGWVTRVVCVREPGHARAHRSLSGHRWSRSNPTPRRAA